MKTYQRYKTSFKPYVILGTTLHEQVKEVFGYKEGVLYWKVTRSIHVKINDVAGCLARMHGGDRYTIRFNRKLYLRSRLVFLYHNGYFPEVVDHINHNQLDDRIENLRAATTGQNVRNKTSHVNSSSKYLGVSWAKRDKRWLSKITSFGVVTNIGGFKSEADAALAYNKAAVRLHKEFANLNIIQP